MSIVEDFLNAFGNEIKTSICQKEFYKDYISDIDYRQHNQLHSRVLGILARAAIINGFYIDIERGVKPTDKQRKFVPDLVLYKGGKPLILIEYESSNSSDYRVVDKDLRNYKRTIDKPPNDINPSFWLIITTLPITSKKKKWSYWANNVKGRLDKHEQKKLITVGPKKYYYDRFITEFKTNMIKNHPLYWANLDEYGLTIEYPSISKFKIVW
jgi:hypothetical protein